MKRNHAKCLGSIEDDWTSEEGASFKPAPTQEIVFWKFYKGADHALAVSRQIIRKAVGFNFYHFRLANLSLAFKFLMFHNTKTIYLKKEEWYRHSCWVWRGSRFVQISWPGEIPWRTPWAESWSGPEKSTQRRIKRYNYEWSSEYMKREYSLFIKDIL